jgi:hypothetical protein
LKGASVQFVNTVNSGDFRAIFLEARESSVVEEYAAVLGSGHGETNVCTSVVVLSVVVPNRMLQMITGGKGAWDVHNAAFEILIFELGVAVPFRDIE